jgi:hypothetical protein
MFSVPLNPKLNPAQFDYFIDFLKNHKDLIYDIYFTSRIPPFMQDAMGDVFSKVDYDLINENAFIISRVTGIPLSATFNNIEIPPTEKNLDTFIEHFKILYDRGVRIVTIPHTLWLLTGKFQRAYPDVLIKNTILRNTQRPNEVIKQVEAGFHYINFDRDLMRDEDTLKRMQDVKKYCKEKLGVDVKYSLLANEGCWGNCPVQDEHFLFNNTRKSAADPTYFNTRIAQFSCPKWEKEDVAYNWRLANFPPWKEEWDRLLNYIDVIKMHGRESVGRLFETMDIIKRYKNNEEILFKDFETYIKETSFVKKRIDVWRTTIRNCKFNCWDCNICDKIVEKNNSVNMINAIKKSLLSAQNNISKISDRTKNIPGLTSDKVKHFMNNLCEMPDCSYLELGVYQGAIFTSVLENNKIIATAIDNWSDKSTVPMRDDVDINKEIGVDKDIFLKNIREVSFKNDVEIIQSDVWSVNLDKLKNTFNILFYDCDHSFESHNRVLKKYINKLDSTFIYVVDDWNWKQVQDGTLQSFKELNLKVLYKEEIFTKGEDKNDFWNGLGIFVLNK